MQATNRTGSPVVTQCAAHEHDVDGEGRSSPSLLPEYRLPRAVTLLIDLQYEGSATDACSGHRSRSATSQTGDLYGADQRGSRGGAELINQ